MERIKLGETIYDLVPNGVPVSPTGGRVILLPGGSSFDAVENAVKTSKSFTVLDELGSPIMTRSGIVYAGYLAKDDNYTIGTEQVQTGADEVTGEPVYETHDVIGTVIIAEFRVPDLREQMAEMEAKIEYMSMMSGIETEV